MTEEVTIKDSTIRLLKADITDLDIQSFVFYARHDLALGSGHGTAISVRGGPAVSAELKKLGSLETTQAVVTGAGEMKAQYIIHAVGPRFQEENIEGKLRTTMLNIFSLAEEKGITSIAFPPMGTGFYGVPRDLSARIMLETMQEYCAGGGKITDMVICLVDSRDYEAFQKQLSTMSFA